MEDAKREISGGLSGTEFQEWPTECDDVGVLRWVSLGSFDPLPRGENGLCEVLLSAGRELHSVLEDSPQGHRIHGGRGSNPYQQVQPSMA